MEVRRDGDLLTLSFDYDGGSSTRYVFDTTKGHNLVSFVSTSPTPEQRSTYEFDFDAVDDVWFPVHWKYNHERAEPEDGELQTLFSREVRFTEQTVNQTLPDDEFSLERMGLRRGDFVHDKVNDFVFQFDPDDQ